jgi:type IV pilus assembly protein PilM
MCVEEITTQKVVDLDAEWFSKIPDVYKDYLADDEKETGPSGEGYVFSVRAVHWHEGAEISDQAQSYIEKTILKNLQDLRKNGDPARKTTNLGITHATMVEFDRSMFIDDPHLGKPAARAPRINVQGGTQPALPGIGAQAPFGRGGKGDDDDDYAGASPGALPGMAPGIGRPAPGTPGSNPDAKQRPYWRFVIQFAYRPNLEGGEGATGETEAASTETE